MAADVLLVLEAGVTKTASFNSTGINVKSGTPASGLVARLLVTSVAGTAPTIAPEIQDSADGTTYTQLARFSTQSITAAGEYFCRFQTKQPYVRLATTIGGTSPSFVYNSHVCQARP